jgi:hypothetical protein
MRGNGNIIGMGSQLSKVTTYQDTHISLPFIKGPMVNHNKYTSTAIKLIN